MNETRKARLAGVIQEELSLLIRQLKDPRVPLVTITRVEVTDDGSQATVYLTLFARTEEGGEPVKQCLEGLASASGFLRRGIAKVLTIKHVPTLLFKEDRGLQNASRVFELLSKIDREEGKTSGLTTEETKTSSTGESESS